MGDELVVLDGSTFFVSQPNGDCEGTEAEGFFHADMRHLSRWHLRLDGRPIRVLTSRTVDYYSARVFGTLASARVGENPAVSVRRDRFIADGIHEDLVIENYGDRECRLRVELLFGADFADIFEVKGRMPKRGRRWVELDGAGAATLRYQHRDFHRSTVLTFDRAATLHDGRAIFDLILVPRAEWRTCIEISCIVDGEQRKPRRGCGGLPVPEPDMPRSLQQWLDDAPRLQTSFDPLNHTYRQSMVDLAALRFRPRRDLEWSLPAAGLPWFMALFGRDALLTGYQTLPFQPHLARTALQALAEFQATASDDFRDADPGKILHELRRGELATLGEVPHSPYYGSHDATLLFLILLDEYERWSGDRDVVLALQPAARAALAWMERFGDPDGDGFLEYETRSRKGLVNQGWKDSWNAILFADGRMAQPPIATCELQGYAYDARCRVARLAREVWHDEPLAVRVEADAQALRARFNREFWNEARGHYVLALDGTKRQVDAMASNAGHLLWSGILDEARAAETVTRLMAPDMFTGWGIRTMSALNTGYNPIEYHNGTVWPHDTGIIAEGMRRYGFREQASALALVLLEAADAFAYRLPEVFAGFTRAETGMPVEYPTACRPQAWAAGAPLLALRTLLGLDMVDGQLHCVPHLPKAIRELALLGIPVRGRRRDAVAPTS